MDPKHEAELSDAQRRFAEKAKEHKANLAEGYPTSSKPDPRLPQVIREEIRQHSVVMPADRSGMPMLDTKAGDTSMGDTLRKAGAKAVEVFALGPKGIKSSDESIESEPKDKKKR